jgi:CheY-like chemotaxis protein/HPt (histidine-containing phosphotransfer) domain-containing protein
MIFSFDTGALEGVHMLNASELGAVARDRPQLRRTRWKIPSARVLVVDDGAENRELVALVLAEQGLWVEEAENGQVALDKVAAAGFDLIFMDMQMPVLDGDAATRELRRRGVTTPVVALTANAMKGFEQEVLAAGCTAYLTKPVDIDLLVQQVAQLLGGERVEMEDEESFALSMPAPLSGMTPLSMPAALMSGAIPLEQSMAVDIAIDEPIRSRFAANKKLAPIVRKFAARLKEQLDLASHARAGGDLPEVARLAHWLAGAAGTVGYDAFTEPARELEAHALGGDSAGTEALLQRIARMADHLELPEVATS